MMTLEMAADIVLRNPEHNVDLFVVFEKYFGLTDRDDDGKMAAMFAEMCGFMTCVMANEE